MRKILLLAVLFITGGMASAQEVTEAAPAANTPYVEDQLHPFSEGILAFHADIVIYPTGMLHVKEKIKVITNRENIKKGIFRTIPVYRKDMYGRKVHTGIHVGEVLKNGQPEPYHESESDGDLTIRIGDADVELTEGIYEYEITYETGGQIGFFDGYDELYWNVTGNDWAFPIEKASATIVLPYGASVLQTACYTGPSGSKETDCHTGKDSSGASVFSTRQRLDEGSGFTVAVGFSPGLITRPPPPTALERFWDRLLFYRAYILAVLGSVIMFGYCFVTWRKHGKDPVKPTPVPTFEPPDGLSPGSIRYLYKKTAGSTGFTAAIVNMAIKKVIRIKNEGSAFTLERGANTNADLPPEEKAIYNKLLHSVDSIEVDDDNYRAFSNAQAAYDASLAVQLDLKKYYLRNTRHTLIGGLVAGLILVLYMLAVNAGNFLVMLFIMPFVGVGMGLFIAGLRSLKDGCLGIFLTVIGGAFSIMPLFMLFTAMEGVPPVAIAFIAAILAAYCWYIYLIKAPTSLGTQRASQIEGFMMYLKTAEEHRLNMLTPPERTPQLFEKLLPYAIALGLENEWGAKFEGVLAQAGYSPDWYNGNHIDYNRLSSSFSTGFASSLSRAQVDPNPPPSSSSSSSSSGSSSWSSGSSGGGSSGGGGGGGGGGGW